MDGTTRIASTSLSNIAKDILRRNNILTVEELCAIKPKDLRKIKGVGGKVYLELTSFIMNYDEAENVNSSENDNDTNMDLSISADYKNGTTYTNSVSDSNLSIAINIIGIEMAAACLVSAEYSTIIMGTMRDYFVNTLHIVELRRRFNLIPKYRLERTANRYIFGYSDQKNNKYQLMSLFPSSTSSIKDIAIDEVKDEYTGNLVKEFLDWCCFDLFSDIEKLVSVFTKRKRYQMVITRRAGKKTTECIARELGITRQTVYNIETSIIKTFRYCQEESQVLEKIVAEKEGEYIVSKEDIKRYNDEYYEELYYLLKQCVGDTYNYDEEQDVFLVGSRSCIF